MSHMEPSEYPTFLLRTLEAFGRKVASHDAEALALMVDVYEKFGQIIRKTATSLSETGVSWNEIGRALDLPSTTARDRWQMRSLEPRGPVVYGLREQDTTEIRYVGQSRNVSARFAQHRSQAYRGTAPVYTWVRKISVARLEVVILERLTESQDLLAAEQSWISRLVDDGHRLTNLLDNATAPQVDADEAEERIVSDWRAARNRKDRERRDLASKRREIAEENSADEIQRILRRPPVEMIGWWRRTRQSVLNHLEVVGLDSEVVMRLSTTELWPLVLKVREAKRNA